MTEKEKVNILLVDDQPSKLLSYEVILAPLDENLLKAESASEAFRLLLKHDIAVILVDVSMPEMDGFELAHMIREHPRFQKTAILFISAIHLSEMDSVRGYELGAVDYMSVPVSPQLLRAKVRVFVELFRKTRELESLNATLEQRVAERTYAVESAMERVMLLAREVDHRAKNSLAVIESILSLTRADDIDAYTASVRGRIRALATAHNLLSESRWEGADLRQLVAEEIDHYALEGRMSVEGEPVSLRPSAAQSMAIAIHELAINAAQHGALSTPAGALSLSWRIEHGSFVLRWSETGGPQPAGVRAQGFGLRVIAASVKAQLNGAIEFDWRPEGLLCVIQLPLSHLAQSRLAGAERQAPRIERGVAPLEGRRILIVEDETLIGFTMSDYLSECGARVVGPFTSVSEALGEGGLPEIDAALLDVNLKGALVYPLADELAARGVPIVFLTGYGAGTIEDRFRGCAILHKPFDATQLHAALAATLPAEPSRVERLVG